MPQVIWKTPHDHKGWKQKNGHYHRSAKGGGEWEFFHLPDEWAIHYTLPFQKEASGKADPLTFHLKPFSFKHTGLFPEQAVNWDWFSGLIHEAGRPVKVLNLFAYTGGATVSAAAAGAAVTHVDASKGMVGWAKENAAASGLADAPIRWLVDDCMKFVEREIRRGNKYDGIIMDPPSYGRGPKGEIWKIEDNIWDFVGLTAQLLSDDALFFLINSYTTGLQPAVLSYMMNSTLTKKFGGHVEAEEIGLPVTESGLVLPCGASGRCSGTSELVMQRIFSLTFLGRLAQHPRGSRCQCQHYQAECSSSKINTACPAATDCTPHCSNTVKGVIFTNLYNRFTYTGCTRYTAKLKAPASCQGIRCF